MKSMDELAAEIRLRIEDYSAAFSSKSPARVRTLYKPDSLITLHQLGGDRTGKGGAGKDITAFLGTCSVRSSGERCRPGSCSTSHFGGLRKGATTTRSPPSPSRLSSYGARR